MDDRMDKPSRRRMLGALATASAFAGLAAVTVAAPATAAPRTAWERCQGRVARLRSASRVAATQLETACEREICGRPNPDDIHWHEFSFHDRAYVVQSMDIEAQWRAFIDSPLGEPMTHTAPAAGFRAALDSVFAHRQALEDNEKQSGLMRAKARYERLTARLRDAETALVRAPAPDGPALRYKLEVLLASGKAEAAIAPADIASLLADVDRLLPTSRA